MSEETKEKQYPADAGQLPEFKEKRIKKLEFEAYDFELTAENAEAQFPALQAEIDKCIVKRGELRAEVTSLEGSHKKEDRDKVKELEHQISSNNNQCSNYEAKLDELRGQCNSLREQANTKRKLAAYVKDEFYKDGKVKPAPPVEKEEQEPETTPEPAPETMDEPAPEAAEPSEESQG
jgi:chromosome segregation ATPase